MVLTILLVFLYIIPESSAQQNIQGKIPVKETIIAGISMVSLPAGSFTMGSENGDESEIPEHVVKIDAFDMSINEITQEQYSSVTGTNPSKFSGSGDLPVEQVTWFDAVRFCNKLSEQAGFEKCYDEDTWLFYFDRNGFRLPSEAEWEYACRAGTVTSYYNGSSEGDLDHAGWYNKNSGKKTHAVGLKERNSWGLYDMHGNVWEWCYDSYGDSYYSDSPPVNPTGTGTGPYRVLRGGSWLSNDRYCRSSKRFRDYPEDKSFNIGFRVVRRP